MEDGETKIFEGRENRKRGIERTGEEWEKSDDVGNGV